jgi:hypothetical protein
MNRVEDVDDERDTMTMVKKCVQMLEGIIDDKTVSRNLRDKAKYVKKGLLNGEESLAVRATSAISVLDEMTTDHNIPFHTRTLVWNIVSQLELIAVEK